MADCRRNKLTIGRFLREPVQLDSGVIGTELRKAHVWCTVVVLILCSIATLQEGAAPRFVFPGAGVGLTHNAGKSTRSSAIRPAYCARDLQRRTPFVQGKRANRLSWARSSQLLPRDTSAF